MVGLGGHRCAVPVPDAIARTKKFLGSKLCLMPHAKRQGASRPIPELQMNLVSCLSVDPGKKYRVVSKRSFDSRA